MVDLGFLYTPLVIHIQYRKGLLYSQAHPLEDHRFPCWSAFLETCSFISPMVICFRWRKMLFTCWVTGHLEACNELKLKFTVKCVHVLNIHVYYTHTSSSFRGPLGERNGWSPLISSHKLTSCPAIFWMYCWCLTTFFLSVRSSSSSVEHMLVK